MQVVVLYIDSSTTYDMNSPYKKTTAGIFSDSCFLLFT